MVLLLLLGLWEAGKVVALTRQVRLLLELGVQPDPRVQLVVASLWALLFWSLAIALWQHRPLTRWLIPGGLLLYTVYQFVLLALFASPPWFATSWLRDVLLATAVILFSAWALNRKTAFSYDVEEGL